MSLDAYKPYCTQFSTGSGGRNFLAVGCETGGIYVGLRGNSGAWRISSRRRYELTATGNPEFRKVLRLTNPSSMAALQEHNKIVIFCDGALSSYSLDLLARVSQGQAPAQSLEASLETIAGQDGGITFFRAGFVANRTIGVYMALIIFFASIDGSCVHCSCVCPQKLPANDCACFGGCQESKWASPDERVAVVPIVWQCTVICFPFGNPH